MFRNSRIRELMTRNPEQWLTWSLSVLIALLMGVYGVVQVMGQQSELRAATERQGLALAEGLSLIGATAVMENLFVVQEAIMTRIQGDQEILSILVLDQEHMVIASSNLDRIGDTLFPSYLQEAEFQDIRSSVVRHEGPKQERLVIFSPLHSESERLGWIRVELSLDRVQQEAYLSLGKQVFVSALLLLVAVFLVRKTVRRLSHSLTRSEARTRLIIDTALDAVLGMDAQGRVTDWNPQAETMFGWKREEALHESLASLIFPSEHGEDHNRGLRQFLETREGSILNKRIEVPARHREGHVMTVELSISPIQSDGHWIFNAFVRDITQRKAMEDQLVRLSAFPRNNPNPIVQTDLEGIVTYVNPAALERFPDLPIGISEHPFLFGLREIIASLIHGPEQARLIEQSVMGSIYEIKVTYLSETERVTLYAHEVTEQKRAAEALQLESSYIQLLQHVAVAANEAEAVESALQKTLDLVSEFTGWPVGHVYLRAADLSETVVPTKIWHFDDAQNFEAFRKVTENTTFPSGIGLPGRVLASGQAAWISDVTQDANFPRATQAINLKIKGGFAFPVLVRDTVMAVLEFFSRRYEDPNPRLLEVVNIIGTQLGRVMERIQAEEELALSRDEALASARSKAEFLATMSHEIRTPMNGVIGMTGLLLDTELTEEQQHFAKTVRSSGEALLTIINDILDFSKIEAGKLDFETIDFDLRTALEETLDLMAEKASDKGLELVGVVFDDVTTAVRGDPGRLRQVLLNLIGNAIKFTDQGEVTVQILRMEETEYGEEVRIQVNDTGVGISQEAQDRLFQPFSQADSSTTRKYGGTGLGLAIARQLVGLMGGQIGVKSHPSMGSQFWFTVRLEKQSAGAERTPLPALSLKGVRVCGVDDHATNRNLLEYYFRDWDMLGRTEGLPSEALEELRAAAARGEPYDVAILDMEMPEMDGLQLARLIQADPVLMGVKLVLLTSLSRGGDVVMARDMGFAAYLTKPVRKRQLQTCLAKAVGRLEAEEESSEEASNKIQKVAQGMSARILVADDHGVNRQLAMLLLTRMGHRVDVVANGQEAVEVVLRQRYDLVLMDGQMPEMDGYEATREIRLLEGHARRTPIVAVTANAMAGDREKCLAAGMDDYVTKPLKVEELNRVLAQWLPAKEQDVDECQTEGLSGKENGEEEKQGESGDGGEHHPPIDLAVLEEWRAVGGTEQPDMLAELIEEFVADAGVCVKGIQEAVVQGNATVLVKHAHGLCGMCSLIGAGELARLAAILESLARSGMLNEIESLVAEVQHEMKRITTVLEREMISGHDALNSQQTVPEVTSLPKTRVLVVDDHTINQELAVLILERFGHRVDLVANGLEAVEAVSRKAYDFVFMDCQMLEMDGYKATRGIRKQETSLVAQDSSQEKDDLPATSDQRLARSNLRRPPIVAMKANDLQGVREKCLAVGMEDSVGKPLESEDEAVVLGRRLPQSAPETPEGLGQPGIKEGELVSPEEVEPTKAGISGNVPEEVHPVSTYDVEGESSDCQETLKEWRMMTGDTYQEFLAKIVQQFLQDAGQCIDAVQKAVFSGDAQAMREAAHGLKGISGNVGAKRLEKLAMELEDASNQPSCDTSILSLDHIQFEFEKVRQILTHELTHVSMNS